MLFNHAADHFRLRQGDRITQLILEKISTPTVEAVEELDDTPRGASGFGSTGPDTIFGDSLVDCGNFGNQLMNEHVSTAIKDQDPSRINFFK